MPKLLHRIATKRSPNVVAPTTQRLLKPFGCSSHLPESYSPRALPLPTNELPGSPGKIAILAVRAALNQSLWHPDDPVLDSPPLSPLSRLCGRGDGGEGSSSPAKGVSP